MSNRPLVIEDTEEVDDRHDVEIRVEILDTVTGERRWSPPYPEEWKKGHSTYWWTEGNGSCDCNREIVFKGSDVMWNEDGSYNQDSQCKSERYRIVAVDPLLSGYTLADFNEDYE